MAKITISEKDISKIPSNEVGNDVVYIPGYAVTGPANTPTLCRTLSEFQNIFGTQPYLFEETETYNDVFNGYLEPLDGNYNFCIKNEVETSYVYAVELLDKGMPIIFERVVDDNLLKAYADLVDSTGNKILRVVAKYPGRYGKSINYILEEDSENYKLTITQDSSFKNKAENDVIYLSKPSTESYTISLDPYSSNYFENVNYGMVDIIKGENFNQDSTLVESSKTEDGLIVETYLTNEFPDTADFSLNTFYNKLESSVYNKLEDKNEYAIKYLTSGGYPNYFESSKLNTGKESISKIMAQVAAKRSDCIAVLDYIKNDNDVNLTNLKTSIQLDIDNSNVQTKDFNFEQIYKYAVMFAPYGKYKSNVLGGTYILPASFAYLNTLAESLKTNPSWYAVAGITRGIVSNLEELVPNMTGAMADDLQPSTGVCINPILNIKPYGYTIWGNRTLYKNGDVPIASSFLNIRSLACDVKKLVYKAATKFMFESISDILWLNFKSEIEPELDKMVSGNGLSDYQIIRKSTTEKATICAIIRLYALEAVEHFDISIELSNSFVNVE